METACKQTQIIQNKIIKQIEAAPPPKIHWWTPFEIDVLKKYYGKKDPEAIAKALGRTRSAIDAKASTLGLTGKK